MERLVTLKSDKMLKHAPFTLPIWVSIWVGGGGRDYAALELPSGKLQSTHRVVRKINDGLLFLYVGNVVVVQNKTC